TLATATEAFLQPATPGRGNFCQNFGMRIRLIISEPDKANSNTIGCSVKPPKRTTPPHSCSPKAPCHAASAIRATSTIDVGMGVPSKYLTLSPPSDMASAVTLNRASRETPQAT